MTQMQKKGFTLIELLVVCGIIAILSVVVFISYSSAKAKSRDARRIGDLAAIADGLLLFNIEKGHMPNSTDDGLVDQGATECSHSSNEDQWYDPDTNSLGTVIKDYIFPIPREIPSGSPNNYHYRYCNRVRYSGFPDNKHYHLIAGLEKTEGNAAEMFQPGEDVCGTDQDCDFKYPNADGVDVYVLKN